MPRTPESVPWDGRESAALMELVLLGIGVGCGLVLVGARSWCWSVLGVGCWSLLVVVIDVVAAGRCWELVVLGVGGC